MSIHRITRAIQSSLGLELMEFEALGVSGAFRAPTVKFYVTWWEGSWFNPQVEN